MAIDLNDYNTEYYHVTLTENVESILKNGLIPQIGERSLDFREKEPLVYLFPTEEDMECAVMQWLGDWYEDEYGEDVKLSCLKINLPYDFPIENGEVEYECISKKTIPAKYIKFYQKIWKNTPSSTEGRVGIKDVANGKARCLNSEILN